jgi:zinc transport system permease protein
MLVNADERAFALETYGPGLLAGLGVVVMCGVLSVLVVVKRLGFVGQGVSHSAFGGIGVAAALAAFGWMPMGEGGALQLGIVVAFCIAAAIGMGAVGASRDVPMDTSIGIFLVASMALGAILVQISTTKAPGTSQSWESILFGSIFSAGPRDAKVAWGISGIVILAAWWMRRKMLFWALDEDAARAFGVPTTAVRLTLMVLLSLSIVVAMRLAGVVLATALLVLPGATALRLSDRLWPVVALSVGAGVLSLLAGIALSLELNWQTGPSVVLVMTAVFALALGIGRVRDARATRA